MKILFCINVHLNNQSSGHYVLAHLQHKPSHLHGCTRGRLENITRIRITTPIISLSLLIKKAHSERIVSRLPFLFPRDCVVVPEWNFASWLSCASDDYTLTETSMCFCSSVIHGEPTAFLTCNIMFQVLVSTWQGRPGQKAPRTVECSFLPIAAACLALEYSRGLQTRALGGECLPHAILCFPASRAVLGAGVARPAPPELLPSPLLTSAATCLRASPSHSFSPFCLSALTTQLRWVRLGLLLNIETEENSLEGSKARSTDLCYSFNVYKYISLHPPCKRLLHPSSLPQGCVKAQRLPRLSGARGWALITRFITRLARTLHFHFLILHAGETRFKEPLFWKGWVSVMERETCSAIGTTLGTRAPACAVGMSWLEASVHREQDGGSVGTLVGRHSQAEVMSV